MFFSCINARILMEQTKRKWANLALRRNVFKWSVVDWCQVSKRLLDLVARCLFKTSRRHSCLNRKSVTFWIYQKCVIMGTVHQVFVTVFSFAMATHWTSYARTPVPWKLRDFYINLRFGVGLAVTKCERWEELNFFSRTSGWVPEVLCRLTFMRGYLV